MLERIEKLRQQLEDQQKAQRAREQELRQQVDAGNEPPLTGSLDEVIAAAETTAASEEELARIQRETDEQERLGTILDDFSIRYAEYAHAFGAYKATRDEPTKAALGERYAAFQQSMATVRENPPVVAFLRSNGFEKYFPEEASPGIPPQDVDTETQEQFHLQQRLLADHIAAAQTGTNLPIEELATNYYPGIDRKTALNRLHAALPKVRRMLREQGYTITNLTPKSEGSKGKTAIYQVEAPSDKPPEPVHPTGTRDEPVRESRLKALTYLVSTDRPDISEVITILGKTKAGKRKAHDLTSWQALVALDRNVKKLNRRVNEGVATEDEQRMHVLMEQFFANNEITSHDFRDYVKRLFGFAPAEMGELTTDASKIEYLDTPVVDGVPFTRRDAVQLTIALNFYRETVKFFCSDCALPDKEIVDNLYAKLGDVLDQLQTEHDSLQLHDAHVIVNRLEAISHYVQWRQQEDFFTSVEQVTEFEFYQVVYNLQMLENARISINGDTYTGLQFLGALFQDPRTRQFIELEMQSRKQLALTTQEMEQVTDEAPVYSIRVPVEQMETPLDVPDIGMEADGETIVFQEDTRDESPESPGRSRKQERLQEMEHELDALIAEVNAIPDFNEPANTPAITRQFGVLSQTVFNQWQKAGYISQVKSTRRGGFPLYSKESIVMLLYLESKRGAGGIKSHDVNTAAKIIKRKLKESQEK